MIKLHKVVFGLAALFAAAPMSAIHHIGNAKNALEKGDYARALEIYDQIKVQSMKNDLDAAAKKKGFAGGMTDVRAVVVARRAAPAAGAGAGAMSPDQAKIQARLKQIDSLEARVRALQAAPPATAAEINAALATLAVEATNIMEIDTNDVIKAALKARMAQVEAAAEPVIRAAENLATNEDYEGVGGLFPDVEDKPATGETAAQKALKAKLAELTAMLNQATAYLNNTANMTTAELKAAIKKLRGELKAVYMAVAKEMKPALKAQHDNIVAVLAQAENEAPNADIKKKAQEAAEKAAKDKAAADAKAKADAEAKKKGGAGTDEALAKSFIAAAAAFNADPDDATNAAFKAAYDAVKGKTITVTAGKAEYDAALAQATAQF